MKANELRIENWVNGNYNGFSKDVQIYEFDNDCIRHTNYTVNALLISSFNPIPLTEEWMIKSGGKKDDDGVVYIQHPSNSSLRFYLVNVFIQLTKGQYSPIMNFGHVIYVHRFQNLYFALTGEELPTKSI